MRNRYRKWCVAGVILALCSSAEAATDGAVGMASQVDVPMSLSVSEEVQISGLKNINFNSSSTEEVPLGVLTGICLYSSTGLVSVSATTANGTTNLAENTADLISDKGVHATFYLQLGNNGLFKNLFVPSGATTLVASTNSLTCDDNVGINTLQVKILKNPQVAGAYKATVTIVVSAA